MKITTDYSDYHRLFIKLFFYVFYDAMWFIFLSRRYIGHIGFAVVQSH